MPDVQDMADPGILESQNRGISRTLEAGRRVALRSREVSESDRNDEKVAVFVILKEFELFPFKTRRNDVSGGVGTKVDTKWTLLCPGFFRGARRAAGGCRRPRRTPKVEQNGVEMTSRTVKLGVDLAPILVKNRRFWTGI